MPRPDFDQLEASLLFCPRCQKAMPIRKRLLLILPQGTKYEYTCVHCNTICGDKLESSHSSPFTRIVD